ncbi:hypothetical protein P4O66_001628 [Electrophorus voltai]|uniref:Uncharacterized protein n=1 Tax=Electrophorus voltai TaxID=2609070 RepID=A0AAD8Z4X8_9TELE|nr:hypothetical protein P4O66_001628 [Electrophorus voltai]
MNRPNTGIQTGFKYMNFILEMRDRDNYRRCGVKKITHLTAGQKHEARYNRHSGKRIVEKLQDQTEYTSVFSTPVLNSSRHHIY